MALLLICLVSLFQPARLHAQEQASGEERYRIETIEGEVLIGTLVSADSHKVVLDARQLGEVLLDRANIESMRKIDADRIRNGEYWFENPQSTRYFFATNALSIPAGEGYYQNTWVLFNNVNYGVSDNFSIGAGTVPLFLFGVDVLPIWILPKLSVSIPQKNLHVAGGAVFGGVLGEDNEGIGLVYGAATVGTRDNNATLGVGYGYARGDFSNTPVINVSGLARVGRTTYLLTENYFFPGSEAGGVLSVGIRWAPRNFAVDFGLFRPLLGETEGFIAAPWLGVTVPFGQ